MPKLLPGAVSIPKPLPVAVSIPKPLPGAVPAPKPPAKAHPFYIAVTEINHNAKDQDLEISCKLFADDLEQILEKNYRTTLDISAERDKASFDKLIPDYVNRHLALVVDGRAVSLVYVGFEKEKESAYCYFQVNKVAAPKKIDLTNSLLHDFNSSQINIIHITVNGKRQSTKLDYPDTRATITTD